MALGIYAITGHRPDPPPCRISALVGRRRMSTTVRAFRRPSGDGATSRRGAERRVLEHAGLVLDHLEGDVRVAVVDAFCARGPGDHREHPDPEAVDESGP